MRVACGIDETLHAVSFGEARRRNAAVLAGIEKAAHQARNRSDAGIEQTIRIGILDRDRLQRLVRTRCLHQRKASEIVGGRICQHQRSILAIEFDAVTGAEERRTAHLQAAAGARCKGERQCNAAFRITIRQREHAAAETRDVAAKPFEIVKAMADEIAEETAAAVTACLPALEAQPCCLVLDVPGHDHVAQPSERPAVQDRLGAPPRRQLGKIEVDDGRPPAPARAIEHDLCAREVGGERLLDEDGLSEIERAARDLRLQRRGNRDGDDRNGAVFDQRPPVAQPARDIRRAGKLGGPRRVGSRERHDLAARVGAKCRQQHVSPVIAADDAHADHGDLSAARNSGPGSRLGDGAVFIGMAAPPFSRPADSTSDAQTENPSSREPYNRAEIS